jgi:hypothetical protein
MLRYHKEVYFAQQDTKQLKTFTERLNSLQWDYTQHCLDHIKDRAIDLEGLLLFIKGLELTPEQIFEYYAEEKSRYIIKVCYRISYIKGIDIILVINEDKEIITIYMNGAEDKHETLRREQYNNG